MKTLVRPHVVGIAALQAEFNRYQTQAFEERPPGFFALELAGECGELANLEKKIWRDPTRTDVLPQMDDEAADVFISLMNYCNSRGIKLEDAVIKKLERIEVRRQQGLMGKTRA